MYPHLPFWIPVSELSEIRSGCVVLSRSVELVLKSRPASYRNRNLALPHHSRPWVRTGGHYWYSESSSFPGSSVSVGKEADFWSRKWFIILQSKALEREHHEIQIAPGLLRESPSFLAALKQKRRADFFRESRALVTRSALSEGVWGRLGKSRAQGRGLNTLTLQSTGHVLHCPQLHPPFLSALWDERPFISYWRCQTSLETPRFLPPGGGGWKCWNPCLAQWPRIPEQSQKWPKQTPSPSGLLVPFTSTCTFTVKTSAWAPKLERVSPRSGLCSSRRSCKYEKFKCFPQFSINLPGCNNRDGFRLKPYLYFLFISWNVSRHIHSLFFLLSWVFY